jgi:copper resistance protein C
MKKILLVLAVLFIIMGNRGLAHTGLKDSNPKKNEVISTALNEVQLTYMTKIEIGSSFELMSETNEMVQPDTIHVEGNQLIGTFLEPLANGNYTVIWSIIGADGHPIKGEIPFEVQVAQVEPSNTSSQTVVSNQEEEEVQDSLVNLKTTNDELETELDQSLAEESSAKQQTSSNIQSDEDSNTALIVLSVSGLGIIVLALLLWRVRRKK